MCDTFPEFEYVAFSDLWFILNSIFIETEQTLYLNLSRDSMESLKWISRVVFGAKNILRNKKNIWHHLKKFVSEITF